MNPTNDNFKHGLIPNRSEFTSLLGLVILVLVLCTVLAMTYSIRFPALVKGRGAVIKGDSCPNGYCITASFSGEDAGKIQSGQTAWLLLKKYPADSYGRIDGRVQRIIPAGSSQWDVIIRLQHGLVTDKNTTIPFDPELSGDVFIVVKNLRLLQRIF
jgi:hypothetical protein